MLSRYYEHELKEVVSEEEIENEKINHQRMSLIFGIFDSLNLAAIFSLFLENFLARLLEETLKYILFPLAALFSIIEALGAWGDVMLTDESSPIQGFIKSAAVIKTISAIAITVAVVGILAAGAIFGAISPVIFSVTIGAKTLFHAIATPYYMIKACLTDDPFEQNTYKQLAKDNFISSVVGLLATSAIVGVFALGHAVVTGVGIVAGALAAVYGSFKLATTFFSPSTTQSQTVPLLQDETGRNEDQPGETYTPSITPSLTSSTSPVRIPQSIESQNETFRHFQSTSAPQLGSQGKPSNAGIFSRTTHHSLPDVPDNKNHDQTIFFDDRNVPSQYSPPSF